VRPSGSWLPMACWFAASVLSPKYEVLCCDQNGPPARREEGAYLNRYMTDKQRSRRPILIATLWAGASWLFFRVARLTRMTKIWALRSRLEKQPTDLRQNTSYFGDRTLGTRCTDDTYRRIPVNGEHLKTRSAFRSCAPLFRLGKHRSSRSHSRIPCK
jgi:hypothetical protein